VSWTAKTENGHTNIKGNNNINFLKFVAWLTDTQRYMQSPNCMSGPVCSRSNVAAHIRFARNGMDYE